AVMELARGHGESARKSERLGEAWKEKLARARQDLAEQTAEDLEDREVLTTTLPAWVERVGGERVQGRGGSMRWMGGKLRLIPERAAAVKEIFRLAGSGYGMASIVKWLTENAVPTFGEWEWYTDE